MNCLCRPSRTISVRIVLLDDTDFLHETKVGTAIFHTRSFSLSFRLSQHFVREQKKKQMIIYSSDLITYLNANEQFANGRSVCVKSVTSVTVWLHLAAGFQVRFTRWRLEQFIYCECRMQIVDSKDKSLVNGMWARWRKIMVGDKHLNLIFVSEVWASDENPFQILWIRLDTLEPLLSIQTPQKLFQHRIGLCFRTAKTNEWACFKQHFQF